MCNILTKVLIKICDQTEFQVDCGLLVVMPCSLVGTYQCCETVASPQPYRWRRYVPPKLRLPPTRLCVIWGSEGGANVDDGLGCDDVWTRQEDNVSKTHTASICRAEDVDSMFLRNVGIRLQVHTTWQTGRTAMIPTRLQSVTPQQTTIDIFIAVKTSNLNRPKSTLHVSYTFKRKPKYSLCTLHLNTAQIQCFTERL